jgi:hypothetical protein
MMLLMEKAGSWQPEGYPHACRVRQIALNSIAKGLLA